MNTCENDNMKKNQKTDERLDSSYLVESNSKDSNNPNNYHVQEADDKSIDNLHPIELTAFSILSGPLDHLAEDFELLGQSQYILFTRLKLIEERLKSFRKVILEDGNYIDEKETGAAFDRIRDLRKRLSNCIKVLSKVEGRVSKLEESTIT